MIVVDDASPDGTYEVVKAAEIPRTNVYLREESPSLGGSVRLGVEVAVGRIIVVMDSDFNHKPEYLPILLSI